MRQQVHILICVIMTSLLSFIACNNKTTPAPTKDMNTFSVYDCSSSSLTKLISNQDTVGVYNLANLNQLGSCHADKDANNYWIYVDHNLLDNYTSINTASLVLRDLVKSGICGTMECQSTSLVSSIVQQSDIGVYSLAHLNQLGSCHADKDANNYWIYVNHNLLDNYKSLELAATAIRNLVNSGSCER